MRSILHAVLIGALALIASAPARGDVLYLKVGTKIEGDVKRRDDGWVVLSGGKTTKVLADQVESIELTPTTQAAPKIAAERLASLGCLLETISDAREDVHRYQRFIGQTK